MPERLKRKTIKMYVFFFLFSETRERRHCSEAKSRFKIYVRVACRHAQIRMPCHSSFATGPADINRLDDIRHLKRSLCLFFVSPVAVTVCVCVCAIGR